MCYLYSLLFFLLMSSFWAFKIPMLFTSLRKKNLITYYQYISGYFNLFLTFVVFEL